MTKRLQNINVMRASDLKTFRTFAAKLRHNMHDVLKLYFGLRAKCLRQWLKEMKATRCEVARVRAKMCRTKK